MPRLNLDPAHDDNELVRIAENVQCSEIVVPILHVLANVIQECQIRSDGPHSHSPAHDENRSLVFLSLEREGGRHLRSWQVVRFSASG